MTPAKCVNQDCPFFYRRTVKGHTEFMCTARKGRPVNKNKPWKLGRIIKIYRLNKCPLETQQAEILGHDTK